MNNKYYVYAHYIPGEDIPFYIGMGVKKRAYTNYGRNYLWKNVVKKHGKEVKILHEGLTREEANQIEIELIAKYGRRDLKSGCLVNMTDGGSGYTGSTASEDRRKTLSEAIKNLGDRHPSKRDSWKKYMRENNPAKSESVRKKISENNAMNDPTKRAKLVGRKHTKEVRYKISEANRARVRTEESKEKTRQALLEYHKRKK